MKKQLFLALILIFAIGLVFAGTPRIYLQRCSLDTGGEAPVTNGATTTDPNYIIRATNMATMEVLGTDLGTPATSIRISRAGTSPNFYTAVTLQLGTFPTQWVAGNVIHMYVQYIPTLETAEWDMTIPTGTTTINIQSPVQVIPPYTPTANDLTVTSTPAGAAIWKDGADTGFQTPHVFSPGEAGTYTVSLPQYTWVPAEHVVPELTDDLTIDFQGTYNPMPDMYTLHVQGPAGYAVTGPSAGTTPYDAVDMDDEVNELLGEYTIEAAPANSHWAVNPILVTADMFQPPTKGKALGSRNSGTRDGLVLEATITFVLQPDPPIVYTVVANGPAGYTVNGNAFPYTVVDDNDYDNDLIGLILTPDAVAGYHWEPASVTVMEGDFVQNTAAYAFELVMDPIPDTWTLDVIGPDGYAIIKGTTDTGFVTDHTFGPTETQADLFGVYSLGTPPAGFYWEPATITVDADTWGTKANYPATIEFTLMQIPTQFTYEVNAFDLAWYNGMGYEFPILYPPFLDPNDVNAQILFNGLPFDPPIYTPYLFGAPGNEPFIAGTYSVLLDPPYNAWQPESVTFEDIITNYATDFLGYQEEDTPVELSSFSATLTGQFYVQLTWVSQTETQMMGYLVYRNTTPDQSTSTLIDHPMIPATNTSTTQTYTVVDNDVNIGGTYYYWLEAIDYNNSSYHGPVSVTVEGNVPPVLPETTSMRSAYPNPFKAGSSTAIEVSLKAGEAGTVTIYNVLGQVVRSFSVNEGSHTINWNGKDSRGNACGSGVYFYKLSTPSLNQTKKMVIVK